MENQEHEYEKIKSDKLKKKLYEVILRFLLQRPN